MRRKVDQWGRRTKSDETSFDDNSIGSWTGCYLLSGVYKSDWEYFEAQYERRIDDCWRSLRKNPKIYCHEYSWNQFLDYVDWHEDEESRRSHQSGCVKWKGTDSFEEAMHLARNGWDGLDKIIPNVQRFPLPQIKSVVDMSWQYDVAGGSVNVSRYLTGAPDCMRRIRRNQDFIRPYKVKKLLFTFNMSFVFEAMDLAAAGYRAYEMVKIMEDANIHVEVVWHIRVRDAPDSLAIAAYDLYVTVKRADDELDLSRIMFALAHPAFLRRLGFSEMERNSEDIRKLFSFEDYGHYGYAMTLPRDMFKNNDDVIYMVASDLFSENSAEVIQAQNEKIANVLGDQFCCRER